LTHVQFVILVSVGWLAKNGAVSQRDVVALGGLDEAMTSQVIRALVDKELLTRVRNEEDRRAWSLSLTAEGLRLADEAVVVVEKEDAEYFGVLGHSQQDQFIDSLYRLRAE
jgi:DNA-binding MarR family transcriptional regulator